jgi:hypothetical protein
MDVFYVRPLSNAEYVIGKIWGNLRVFLLLNLIIMAITAAFNSGRKEKNRCWADPFSRLIYIHWWRF